MSQRRALMSQRAPGSVCGVISLSLPDSPASVGKKSWSVYTGKLLCSPICLHVTLQETCTKLLCTPICLHVTLQETCKSLLLPPSCTSLLSSPSCTSLLSPPSCTSLLSPPFSSMGVKHGPHLLTETRIQAFETKSQRKPLCTSSLECNINVWVRSKINFTVGPREPLLATVKRQELAWFGHVTHHDSLSKTILRGTLMSGQPNGQQRKCWMDNIKVDIPAHANWMWISSE